MRSSGGKWNREGRVIFEQIYKCIRDVSYAEICRFLLNFTWHFKIMTMSSDGKSPS